MAKTTILLSLFILIFNGSITAQNGTAESASGFLTSLPPEAPVLFSPMNAESLDSNSVTFIWNYRIHSASYNIQISKQEDFTELLISENFQGTSTNIIELEAGFEYYWRVSSVNVAGESAFSNTWEFSISSLGINYLVDPEGYGLWPATPNPFSYSTTLTYVLQDRENIRLVILNHKGQIVRVLKSGLQNKGTYSINWDGKNNDNSLITCGLYYCVLQTPKRKFMKKILFLR